MDTASLHIADIRHLDSPGRHDTFVVLDVEMQEYVRVPVREHGDRSRDGHFPARVEHRVRVMGACGTCTEDEQECESENGPWRAHRLLPSSRFTPNRPIIHSYRRGAQLELRPHRPLRHPRDAAGACPHAAPLHGIQLNLERPMCGRAGAEAATRCTVGSVGRVYGYIDCSLTTRPDENELLERDASRNSLRRGPEQ